ncbi:MAG: MogA/MoaB family molybdenum cofactor biosynthesis protein [Conexivisphaerales archaeon]
MSERRKKFKPKPHMLHKSEAKQKLKGAVITISTSRYYNAREGLKIKDESGDLICKQLRSRGHTVFYRSLVPDDILAIRLKVLDAARYGLDFIITTGGTGISRTDVTVEAIQPLLDKTLPGFGEYFRAESSKSIGSSTIMSRAMLGSMNGIIVACLPGSPDSVKLGMKIILDELPHLVSLAGGS